MEITEIRVYPRDEERLKAYVTVTFDGAFVVRNMKIVQTKDKTILSMPSRKLPDGTHKDICHPVNQEMRERLEKAVFAAYEKALKEGPPLPPAAPRAGSAPSTGPSPSEPSSQETAQ